MSIITPDPGDFTPQALAKIAPPCGDCGTAADVQIVQGVEIYPHRPDLWTHPDGQTRYWWKCSRCSGYCGIHRGTLKPLGTPAGQATRKAREEAHAAFDPLWRKRMRLSGLKQHHARGKGYKWLAAQMGVPAKECHIGEMTVDQCRRVVEICRGATQNVT